ncbi:MAG: hypothetical protein ACI4TM_07495 [Candidatus Cryptobacteroides sp.]
MKREDVRENAVEIKKNELLDSLVSSYVDTSTDSEMKKFYVSVIRKMSRHLNADVTSRIIFSSLMPVYRKYKWQESWVYDLVLDEGLRTLRFRLDDWTSYLKQALARHPDEIPF